MKVLMRGNEAIAEGAVYAGCKYFFSYPITPQSEILHYMARRLPEVGGVFLQADSETAAINMVFGASACGVRVMTASSGPGISLKQEGISYLSAAELPCVIVNVMRGGPGLGGVQPAQSDYFQATRGGGHGDYRNIVLAPSNVQECFDFTKLGFDLADKYRTPVMIIIDGALGQMMEDIEIPEFKEPDLPDKPWALGKGKFGAPNHITSMHLDPEDLEKHNLHLLMTYEEISFNEQRWDSLMLEDAEIVLVGYGTVGRILEGVTKIARERDIKVGCIRPITLYPFPAFAFTSLSQSVKAILTVEMSLGQMIEDVKLTINGKYPVYFYGRVGIVPTYVEILDQLLQVVQEVKL
ncbi:MAG TPA: 3-methyl-2-oxobutanoate dehydrogenase subunit VorB [bacterium]|nr:3-methyl-2-oxobutanoate dehydrogenase subunit VorB [bacterium]